MMNNLGGEIDMKSKNITRREFIRVTSSSTAAIAIGSNLIQCSESHQLDPKGLPTRVLGKTGMRVPLIAFGTGSRWCSVENEDEALNILTYALDNGLFYWDTAHIYTNGSIISEERLGKIIKHRRKEVFLSTKCATRDPDEAKKNIETSLTRLQTDHVDILKIHHIEDEEDLATATKKGGLYDVILSMKEQGITRFIGFSGHRSDVTMAKAATDYNFDTMLVALNHFSDDGDKFEEKSVSAAAEKNMGIMVMKVIRPRETVNNIVATDLIKYALSLNNVHGAVIGIDSMEVLKENIELLKSFKPLIPEKMNEIRASLYPFYKNKNLEWMKDHYRDGQWG
jgi:predicted aldo/keto reductase-like oxidoreductase